MINDEIIANIEDIETLINLFISHKAATTSLALRNKIANKLTERLTEVKHLLDIDEIRNLENYINLIRTDVHWLQVKTVYDFLKNVDRGVKRKNFNMIRKDDNDRPFKRFKGG